MVLGRGGLGPNTCGCLGIREGWGSGMLLGWGIIMNDLTCNEAKFDSKSVTVMILCFQTDRSGRTVQTQIRLLLEEQSDQGLHCLQFQLHLLGALLFGKAILFKF